MPRLARSVMERFVTSSPFQKICPLLGCMRPITVFANDVLPPPFGPRDDQKFPVRHGQAHVLENVHLALPILGSQSEVL